MVDAQPPPDPHDPLKRAVEAIVLDVARWTPPKRREYVRPLAYSPGTVQAQRARR